MPKPKKTGPLGGLMSSMNSASPSRLPYKAAASFSSTASLSELAPPPLASTSKRRSNVEDTAAIDALFDDGPKQKSKGLSQSLFFSVASFFLRRVTIDQPLFEINVTGNTCSSPLQVSSGLIYRQ